MDWQTKYADKIVDIKTAMSHIKTGDCVTTGDFCSESSCLTAALAERARDLPYIRVITGGNIGREEFLAPEISKHVKFTSLCAAPLSRRALDERRADYLPCFFHEWPKLMAADQPEYAGDERSKSESG